MTSLPSGGSERLELCYHDAMTDSLEVRIAHLEGAYEQVDKRLAGVESVLIHLRADLNLSNQQVRGEIHQLRTELTGRMDNQFHWLLGAIFSSWVTLLLAIFFRS